jgi:hypothetical protein
MTPARNELSPVARFSITLGAILAATALVLAGGTAFLIERYVEDETARITASAVASHFGTVFSEDVFDRELSEDDRERFETIVAFHLSIYGIVATQFFVPSGTIVFSYDEDEIGRRVDPAASSSLSAALNGASSSTRQSIVADLRYARPAAGPYAGPHEHGSAASTPELSERSDLAR